MKAMVLKKQKAPLEVMDVEIPKIHKGQVLIKVEACGVCRTDLHIMDGELTEPKLPLIPGHEIVGKIIELGQEVKDFNIGDRVGVPWLGYTCGRCKYCQKGLENLCDKAKFTGYTLNGGYAEFCIANKDYIFKIPDNYKSHEAAPLLCAGLIGFRSYNMVRYAKRIGLYGFGAAAHIICQIACFEGKEVFAFTRDGDKEKQKFAKSLGALWAGGSSDFPSKPLDAAIIFAPVGSLVPQALKAVDKAGKVICAGIYMSDIPKFPYEIIWHEKQIKSVANLTKEDGHRFMEIAAKVNIKLHVNPYPLLEANRALNDLKSGKIKGAAVLIP